MNACRIHGTIAQPWRTGLKTPWKLWRGKNKDKKIIVMELRKGVKFMVKSVWVIALRTFTRARRTRSLLLVRDDSEKNLKAQWNERSHILGIHNRQLYFICINISQLPFSLPLSLSCVCLGLQPRVKLFIHRGGTVNFQDTFSWGELLMLAGP